MFSYNSLSTLYGNSTSMLTNTGPIWMSIKTSFLDFISFNCLCFEELLLSTLSVCSTSVVEMIPFPPSLPPSLRSFHIRVVLVDPPRLSLPEVDSGIFHGVPWSQEQLWIFNERCNRTRERKCAENMIRGWREYRATGRERQGGGGGRRGTRLPSESKVFVLKGKAAEKQRQRKLDGWRHF